MTYKEALTIIRIEEKGKHEYLLICMFCGDFKSVETDAPAGFAIEMAKAHKKCKEVSNA